MSVVHQIRSLYDKKNFVKRLHRSMKRYNREFGDDLDLEDLEARSVAGDWRRILTSNYDFADEMFEVLRDEIFGELLYCMITRKHPPFSKDLDPPPPLSVVLASLTFILDITETVLNRTIVRDRVLIERFAATLLATPRLAHTWGHALAIPDF